MKFECFRNFQIFSEIRFFRIVLFLSFLNAFVALVKRFHDEWWHRRLSRFNFGPKSICMFSLAKGQLRIAVLVCL